MTKSTDEEPKKKIAKRVVAAKRRYFLPSGSSVLAVDAEDAINKAAQGEEQNVEDGDE